MKKIFLLLTTILIVVVAFTQPVFTYKIKADSVLITNDSCEAELILENSTKNSKGFLYNRGNGRTEFRQAAIKLDDLHYLVGNDTITLTAAPAAWKLAGNSVTPATDFIGSVNNASVRLRTNNNERIVIDSNGKTGVGVTVPSGQLHIKATTDTAALVIQGSASQTRHLLDLKNSSGTLLSYFNKGGGFYFAPPMDQMVAALHLVPTFNGAYHNVGPFDAFLLDGTNMGQFGIYQGENWSYIKIKDPVGSELFKINNKGKTIFGGTTITNNRDGSILVNPDVTGSYHTNNDFDNVYITATGTVNYGLYNGHKFRLLRVTGHEEALTATREGDIGIGTLLPNSKMQVTGSVSLPIINTSSNLTLNATHYTVTVDASAGNRTITLPNAVGAAGRIYVIKKTDVTGNNVTIATTSSQTIDGAANKMISTQYAGYTVQSDNTNWMIIGTY
jgi:hypothetical protein